MALLLLCLNGLVVAAQQKDPGKVRITVIERNTTLGALLDTIGQRAGVRFYYSNRVLNDGAKVTVNYRNKPLQQVLVAILKKWDVTWSYASQGKSVLIEANKKRPVKKDQTAMRSGGPVKNTTLTVSGKVTSSAGSALPGTAVHVKGMKHTVSAGENGEFSLNLVPENSTLVFSSVGYRLKEMLAVRATMLVVMEEETYVLGGTVVQGYGSVLKKTTTSNIARVRAEEIAAQPVLNPLAALEGRVPGLLVTQQNGSPGGGVKVQIRGIGSIGAAGFTIGQPVSNDPLFIINNVPFAPNNSAASGDRMSALNGGLSPFASINPEDIESIEILKDADATAIYGSRGANGVIIITTKRGKPGNTQVQLRTSYGINRLNYNMPLLDTKQYLQLRREAFANDGKPVTGDEFTVFDTSRYTNFTKMMLGQPSYQTNVQLSLTGGDTSIQFYAGAGYERESATYAHIPGQKKFGAYRPSFHLNIDGRSTDKKLSARLNLMYTTFRGALAGMDPSALPASFAPNYPSFTDSAGQLVWNYKGVNIGNAYATLYNEYKGDPDNFAASLTGEYKLSRALQLVVVGGYNAYRLNETSYTPKKAMPPYDNEATNSAAINNASINSYIMESHLTYKRTIGNQHNLQAMIGSTWQQYTAAAYTLAARNFLPDNLAAALVAPGRTTDNKQSEYRYQAFFGRLNYNIRNTYILNLTANRDGSSRFAPTQRFSVFGAAGAAWIFTNEDWVKKHLPFLSFGKWRASYGITGNDGIGNYRYLSTYGAVNSYQGQTSVVPAALFNPTYTWEKNTKMETAADLAFFDNRITLGVAWYRTRTGNQLLNSRLPSQTGFTSVLQNFPAVVQNSGIELELNTINSRSARWRWTSSFNISFNKNKLISFPGLAQTPYADFLAVGESITAVRGLNLKGVNPVTGLYEFEDKDGSHTLDKKDYTTFGDTEPAYYGGLDNRWEYKNWKCSIFLTFKKQDAKNYLSVFGAPGMGYSNVPAHVLGNYWQKPGDVAQLQRLTQSVSSPAYQVGATYLGNSNGVYSDASFLRVKNIELAYSVKKSWLAQRGIKSATFFLQARNCFTLTSYKGPDPEITGFTALPSIRTIIVGVTVSFLNRRYAKE
jgi:TonB-linked SusC/RagA family outer membrane protein